MCHLTSDMGLFGVVSIQCGNLPLKIPILIVYIFFSLLYITLHFNGYILLSDVHHVLIFCCLSFAVYLSFSQVTTRCCLRPLLFPLSGLVVSLVRGCVLFPWDRLLHL